MGLVGVKHLLTREIKRSMISKLSDKTGFTDVKLIFRLRVGTLGNVCIK